eukprot:1157514-Pelagomonas_calceolata.AAC.10
MLCTGNLPPDEQLGGRESLRNTEAAHQQHNEQHARRDWAAMVLPQVVAQPDAPSFFVVDRGGCKGVRHANAWSACKQEQQVCPG